MWTGAFTESDRDCISLQCSLRCSAGFLWPMSWFVYSFLSVTLLRYHCLHSRCLQLCILHCSETVNTKTFVPHSCILTYTEVHSYVRDVGVLEASEESMICLLYVLFDSMVYSSVTRSCAGPTQLACWSLALKQVCY